MAVALAVLAHPDDMEFVAAGTLLRLQRDPPTPPVDGPVAVYHAQPHGNRDPLGAEVRPTPFVDVSGEVLEQKTAMLACHRSHQQWLGESQGLASYLETMRGLMREVGEWSGRFEHAEGWRRRLTLGFCAPDADPLAATVSGAQSKRRSDLGDRRSPPAYGPRKRLPAAHGTGEVVRGPGRLPHEVNAASRGCPAGPSGRAPGFGATADAWPGDRPCCPPWEGPPAPSPGTQTRCLPALPATA
jgi:hypothetical protein